MAIHKKLFNEIRYFIVIFSMFGLWPILPSKPKYNVFLIIFSLVYICFIFGMFWSTFYFTGEKEDHTLSMLVQFSFLMSILIAHFTVILEALINRNAQMNLIEKFSYIDWLLQNKFQLTVSYRKEKNVILIRFATIIFILVFIRTILTFRLNIEHQINNFWFHCTFSIWILRLRFIQVIFFVYMLRNRLRLIRDKLKEFLITSNLYVKSKNRWRFYHDASRVFVLDMSTAKRSLYDRLLNVKQIYGALHEICEFMNIIFGWSLLTIIAQSFFDFSASSYWIYLALDKSDFTLAADYLIILSPIVILLIVLFYLCSSCLLCVSLLSL